MSTPERQYKDVAGNPVSLDWLVRNEPKWAANQIRHRDRLDADNKRLREALDYYASLYGGIGHIANQALKGDAK